MSDICDGDFAREFFCRTVGAELTSVPAIGTLPFNTQFTVTLSNNFTGQVRREAGVIDVWLANGTWFLNWRAGFTNIGGSGVFTTSFSVTMPSLGALVGDNTFILTAEDVTPAPYNQPPYPPSGDTDTASCTVTGIAP